MTKGRSQVGTTPCPPGGGVRPLPPADRTSGRSWPCGQPRTGAPTEAKGTPLSVSKWQGAKGTPFGFIFLTEGGYTGNLF